VRLDEFLAYLAEEPGWVDVGRVGITSRDSSGDSPLHAALWAGDDEAARALVDAGADVNAPGEMSETPLHVAVAQGNTAMARHLLDHGADWDTVSELGFSARQRALSAKDVELRKLAQGPERGRPAGSRRGD
jgi:ankyrin repeat protein